MKCLLITLLLNLLSLFCFGQMPPHEIPVDFRHGSEVLYGAFNNNKTSLDYIKSNLTFYQKEIRSGVRRIQMISIIPENEKGNMAAINMASLRGAIIRQWILDNFPDIKKTDFIFLISFQGLKNQVEVSIVDQFLANKNASDIFYTLEKMHPEKIEYALSLYKQIPLQDTSLLYKNIGIDLNIVDPTFDTIAMTRLEGHLDEKVVLTVYYRWDKYNLDTTYLTNQETLRRIDSLMNLKSSEYIDSLRIIAYASPEGPVLYNQRLSQQRANTLKNYILTTYSKVKEHQIYTDARGENWDGFRRMAEADLNLPMREQILEIINNPNINDSERQSKIARLKGGKIYRNYILPNYYRYLRTGASLFVIYSSGIPLDIDFKPIDIVLEEEESDEIVVIVPEVVSINDSSQMRFPIAFRTNLLGDAVGLFNFGVEFPIKKHWSCIVEGGYAYWRSSNHLFALQSLEYGGEFRYWFPSKKRDNEPKGNNERPLQGWQLGLYGRYWQRYDVQWIDGYQGDETWSAGITAGYSLPIWKQLSIEFSLGVGYVSTSEYRYYHKPEYDAEGNYRLMWQQTGVWSGFSLTKARVVFVWLLQTEKKGGKL